VPGDAHPAFENAEAARQVLNDAEDELRSWQPNYEPVHSTSGSLGVGAMPGSSVITKNEDGAYGSDIGQDGNLQEHPAYREKAGSDEGRRVTSSESTSAGNGSEMQYPHSVTEAERRQTEAAGVF
jgi:hypothetical protein